jgi:hypothetical protein
MPDQYREIQIICKECKGIGIKKSGDPETEEPCMDCNRTGYTVWGRLKVNQDD